MRRFKMTITKQEIKNKIHEMAEEHGLINVTLGMVSGSLKFSPGSFRHIMEMSFTEYKELIRLEFKNQNVVASNKRVSRKERKTNILNIAYEMVNQHGFGSLKRKQISINAGVSQALVSHYFSNLAQIKRMIISKAIENEDLKIIGDAILLKVDGHEEISEALRRASFEFKLNGNSTCLRS